MSEIEVVNKIALSLIPGLGSVHAKALMDYYESATQIFQLSQKDIEIETGIKNKFIENLCSKTNQQQSIERAKTELEFMNKHGIEGIFYDDPNYPQHLTQFSDAPYLLFKKGNSSLNTPKQIAIVGARKATSYGKEFTEMLVKKLAHFNTTIVSGLAYGIDSFAHKSAVKYNTPTIAALGHGLDTIYPTKHRKLAASMLENGALISEYMSGTPTLPANFPKRNRIVAGMVDAVIIVEAAIKGGALVTAKIADSYQKEIFAVPGRSHDKYSRGCNHLIKNQKATLLDDPEDLPMELGWEEFNLKKKFAKNKFLEGLPIQEQEILKALLQFQSLNIEELSSKTEMNISNLSSILLSLELDGKIIAQPGNRYAVSLTIEC